MVPLPLSTGGSKAPKVPANAYPAALAKNQTPINKDENMDTKSVLGQSILFIVILSF
jgi:hypothetical protein